MPEHNPEEQPNLEAPHSHPHLQHTELPSEIPLIAAFLENIKSIIEYIATPLTVSPSKISINLITILSSLKKLRLNLVQRLFLSVLRSLNSWNC